jgi:hypothetical protein
MATISRGYNFRTNEQVTAVKLHNLVDNANVSGLSVDDFSGDIHGVASASPASATEGDVWRVPEAIPPFDGSAYSLVETHYAVHTKFGPCMLFLPWGMETRRFMAGSDGAAYAIGAAVELETTGGGAETMSAFADKIGANEFALDILGTVGSETIVPNTHGRIIMCGPSPVRTEVNRSLGGTWPHFLKRTNSLQLWGLTSASDTDCIHGFRTSDYNAGAGWGLVPGWVLGGPVWRGA